MQTRDNADLLEAELNELDQWLQAQQLHPAYETVLRIRRKLRTAFKYTAYLSDYLNDAMAVNAALTKPHDTIAIDTLRIRAESAQGAPHPERKALGASLIVLGIGLLALSLLVMSTLLSFTFPLIGFFLLAGGSASTALGIGFFRSGQQQGLARELNNLHTTLADSSHQDYANRLQEFRPTTDPQYSAPNPHQSRL